ncbi:MAG: cadmium-translocating P-type ATPase [Ruminococcus sp.]|nr:cadmium-translocating P-type ATPase [Ruminococcus sp.]
MRYEFILEGLNCAHCAGKIEEKIKNDGRFSDVYFNFATKLLTLESEINSVKDEIALIVDSIEDGVSVTEKNSESDKKNSKGETVEKILLITSAVICAVVFVMHLKGIENIALIVASCISALMAGYKVFLKGIRSIIKLNIDETTLLTIAVIAAVIIGEFVEACAVTVLFVAGEWIEEIAVNKSRKDISKLAQIKEDYAYIEIEDGTLEKTRAEDVKIGTEIFIKPYSRIPLDGIVTNGNSLIDTSALTGESVPMSAGEGTQLLSGMLNSENAIKIRTTNKYSDSAATRILKLVEESAKNKGKTDKFITKFAKIYTPIIIMIALLIAVVPSIITGDFSTWIYRSLVCLVSSCPCAIVISVPLAYYSGIGGASKVGVLIKGGKYIEALSESDIVAFDKTGTLTTGKMKVSEVLAYDGHSNEEVLKIAMSVEALSSHPIAKSIVEYSKKKNISPIPLSSYNERPHFGVSAKMGEKTVSCGGFDNELKGVKVMVDNKTIGVIRIADNIREESSSVIKKLKNLGIKKIMMLTGDNENAAKSVSKSLHDIEYHSKLLPEDKLRLVEKEINEGNTCVFVGDGINDAPVMAASSCGVAMGLGSQAAIESADVVLSSGDLKHLPDAVKISRKTMNIVKANIIFALSFKAIVIVLAALGIASMWLGVLADTGVSVLCILNSTRLLKK